ncbi:16S rRNA (cytidine(1402)-2'-O)-methyltransferase [Leucothrix pacifica]|uniref:Ribosomal RNA small subunit methyltransferase I n=1 Tax=Leucothrix pacifica TaxID=1247513 RepID=A0A317CAX8_9GAMM|nr:16S rRNA (cytidine(1402)-2'-O)-methyltransferase [Leucothrix pacifica]PWQ95784.1 16S rRNA (cytidine(1402)-2'-O)-methyltransferase [Leucothrix pacifica]
MQIEPGTLYVVATPIGNLGDITQRALDVLAGVDRVCAEDTRTSKRLLTHFGLQKRLVALHDHNERDKLDQLTEWLQSGESLALISDAGTPLISDPGYHLVQHLRELSIPVVPIPGACAIIAALSVAGLPTDRFVFEGFLPAKSAARKQAFQKATQQTCTQVYYESSHRIVASLRDLSEVIEADRRVVLSRELTKMFEQSFSGTASEVLKWLESEPNHQKGEFVVMVQGAFPTEASQGMALEPLLKLLMAELSVKQSASLAAKITGENKNHCYKAAMALRDL